MDIGMISHERSEQVVIRLRSQHTSCQDPDQNNNISQQTEICLFNSNVKPVLSYGSEIWMMIRPPSPKCRYSCCLRGILQIHCPNNIDLCKQTNQLPAIIEIGRRRWRWVELTLRKPASSINQTSPYMELNP